MKKILTFIILSIMLQSLTATATEQKIPCRLTCENTDYVKPGGQVSADRELPPVGEKAGKQIKKAYDLMQTPLGPMINAKKALSIVNKLNLDELNAREKFLVYKLRGFCYISLKNNKKAIENYKKIVELSPDIDSKEELQYLYNLSVLLSINNDHNSSLKYLLDWAKLTDHITTEEYRQISLTYKALNDLPRAIANQARAIEVMSESEKPALDYIKLKKLYESNNQITEANKIQSILNSLPGANEPIPIIKAAYEYPTDAVIRRIEGDCIVTFDITPTGSTENAHVKDGDCTTIDGKPTKVFIKASIKAARLFKYEPKTENGKPVYVRNVSNKFSYRIAK